MEEGGQLQMAIPNGHGWCYCYLQNSEPEHAVIDTEGPFVRDNDRHLKGAARMGRASRWEHHARLVGSEGGG